MIVVSYELTQLTQGTSILLLLCKWNCCNCLNNYCDWFDIYDHKKWKNPSVFNSTYFLSILEFFSSVPLQISFVHAYASHTCDNFWPGANSCLGNRGHTHGWLDAKSKHLSSKLAFHKLLYTWYSAQLGQTFTLYWRFVRSGKRQTSSTETKFGIRYFRDFLKVHTLFRDLFLNPSTLLLL